MRKIRSRGDVARSRKNNNILIGVFMILLLVVAPIGYSLFSGDSESSNVVNEVGLDFVRDGGLWKVVFDNEVFAFQYLPSEVTDISVNGVYDFGDYAGEVLYFVDANNGASEILNNLGRYVLRYQSACLRSGIGDLELGIGENYTNCEGDLPTKGCESNLIIFEPGNETAVWQDGGCVYIVGDGVRGADAFLYKTLKMG